MKFLKIAMVVILFSGAMGFAINAESQGAFYVEEKVENRIYVFNNPKFYQMWKEGGEMGVSITRIAAGPNGETLIFDSNNAIHMYNLKHNLPAEIIIEPEEKKPKMTFSWKDGKTTFESDNASLILSNRVQFRYTFADPEGDDNSTGSFRMRRVKTKLEGWFFVKELTYELQLNWADTTNALEDANLNYDITADKRLQVKAGQFKVPFGRQELTSSGSQQFVDRSIVSNEFARGRDIGVQMWGLAMGSKIDWRVGVFNGAGRNRTANDNDDYQTNARVTFQPWGDVKYSESDFESSDSPLLAIAAQYEKNNFVNTPTAPALPFEIDREIIGGDVVLKYKGLFVFSEFFSRTLTPATTGIEFDSDGYAIQAGYFVIPQRFEIAGRYAAWDPNGDVDNNNRTETGVALGYFWNKHNLKLQGDYRILEDDARGSKDNEARVQLQFIF